MSTNHQPVWMQHLGLTSSVDVADCLLKVSVLPALAGLGYTQFGHLILKRSVPDHNQRT